MSSECAGHGTRTVYDPRSGSLRCRPCGHRVRKDGKPVQSTKSMPPWKWPGELAGRRRARRTSAMDEVESVIEALIAAAEDLRTAMYNSDSELSWTDEIERWNAACLAAERLIDMDPFTT